MSILTFKIKHDRNFSAELFKAWQIAKFAMRTKCRSSKQVKQFGLSSSISNQILKKYSGNKVLKKISSVKLTIPNQSTRLDKTENKIKIPCLKLEFNYQFRNDFVKINQVEVDHKYLYVSVELPDQPLQEVTQYLGVDRNTTGHCAVVAVPQTSKVYKMGKKAFHTHRKYKKIREHLQEKEAKKKLKKLRRREKNIVKDINHKISRKIVELAQENKCGIKLEKLEGIRKKRTSRKKNKSGESFRSSINNWNFYQLQQMIEYKARICGIPVIYIAPQYTSQMCSRCGLIGNRSGKKFSCPHCGHVDHADSNAAFNIAFGSPVVIKKNNEKILKRGQSTTDRDVVERSTDTRQLETCIGQFAQCN